MSPCRPKVLWPLLHHSTMDSNHDFNKKRWKSPTSWYFKMPWLLFLSEAASDHSHPWAPWDIDCQDLGWCHLPLQNQLYNCCPSHSTVVQWLLMKLHCLQHSFYDCWEIKLHFLQHSFYDHREVKRTVASSNHPRGCKIFITRKLPWQKYWPSTSSGPTAQNEKFHLLPPLHQFSGNFEATALLK